MRTMTQNYQRLFSYGTLQDEAVQIGTFGRTLLGTSDALVGHALKDLQICDPRVIALSGKSVHQILVETGNAADVVFGTVFEISDEELEKADTYEVDDYIRTQVILRSGLQAWVYMKKNSENPLF